LVPYCCPSFGKDAAFDLWLGLAELLEEEDIPEAEPDGSVLVPGLVPGLPPGSHPGSSSGAIDVVLPPVPPPVPPPPVPGGLVVELLDPVDPADIDRDKGGRGGSGWQKAGARHPGYNYGRITGESGFRYGKILHNTHVNSLSLDAHCDRCGDKVNRRFREHGSRGIAHHQGRPMGSLIAWLKLECRGSGLHKLDYCVKKLPLTDRASARGWGYGQAALRFLFEAERERFPHEEGDEPSQLA